MTMKLFIPITKVDEARREVWGVAAEEAPDKAGEIFDYASSKPRFEAWSNAIAKATDGKSLGNLRAMHKPIAAGKLIALEPNDEVKKIFVGAKVVDDGEWNKVIEGVYSGFSIGGDYAKRWNDGAYKRYTAEPSEISLVDNPAMYGATFEVIKADGVTELRKFAMGASPTGGSMKKTQLDAVRQALAKLAPTAAAQPSDADEPTRDDKLKSESEKQAEEKTQAEKVALIGNLQKLSKCFPEPATNWSWMPMPVEKPSYAQEESFDIEQAMYAMQSLSHLSAGEADAKEPEQVQLLNATIAQLWQFIAGELAEILEQAGELPGEEAAEAEPEAAPEDSALQMAVKIGELQKAGARLSTQSKDALHKIRDGAMALCACDQCGTMQKGISTEKPAAEEGTGEEGVDKTMKPEELKKLFDEWSAESKTATTQELQKLAGAIPANDTLAKMIGDAVAPLAKAEDVQKVVDQAGELSKRFDGIEGRIQALEKQPDPRLPVLRVVKRDGDAANTPDEARTLLEKLMQNPALSEDAKRDIGKAVAFEEIKQTMKGGPAKLG